MLTSYGPDPCCTWARSEPVSGQNKRLDSSCLCSHVRHALVVWVTVEPGLFSGVFCSLADKGVKVGLQNIKHSLTNLMVLPVHLTQAILLLSWSTWLRHLRLIWISGFSKWWDQMSSRTFTPLLTKSLGHLLASLYLVKTNIGSLDSAVGYARLPLQPRKWRLSDETCGLVTSILQAFSVRSVQNCWSET